MEEWPFKKINYLSAILFCVGAFLQKKENKHSENGSQEYVKYTLLWKGFHLLHLQQQQVKKPKKKLLKR